MASVQIAKAPDNRAVLPFYATSALAFLVLCILLCLSADQLLGHFFHPRLLTVVHTAALGWGTMIIFGATYQLMPVICERDLYSSRLAIFSWYLLTVGTVLLTSTFWNFYTGNLMILGGSFIVAAVLCFTFNILKTAGSCTQYSIQKLFISTSALWLVFTTTMGLLLVIHWRHPFFSGNHLDLLKLHAHAGLGGWFLQLIIGVSTKLIPMFLLGRSSKTALLKWSYGLQNLGLLLFLWDGFLGNGNQRGLAYGSLVFLGIVCWLVYLYDVFRSRARKKIDLLLQQVLFSLWMLVMAISLLPLVYYGSGSQWAMVYGALLFMGWITGIILGMTFKTLPFIVWNQHYKGLTGIAKVPLPKQLYAAALIRWQWYLYLAALVMLVLGLALRQSAILQAGLFLWVMVAGCYGYNVFRILRHKTNILS